MITPLEIIEKINDFTVATEDQSRRTYLGASEIGERCSRKLWYKFRWCGQEQFDGRMLRLFARGDREEPVVRDLLNGSGFIVQHPFPGEDEDLTEFQRAHNERFRFKDCEGHFAGKCDGVAGEGDYKKWQNFEIDEDSVEWCLLEIKTWKILGGGNFSDLKRQGVKECEPKYYAQLQTYLGQLGLENALFIAVCKENDDIYIEIVPFNQQDFAVCLSKAESVINATSPPERISNNPTTFSCRYCNFRSLCHENTPLHPSNRHCRNCANGHPSTGGTWDCNAGHTFGILCENYHPIAGGSAAA